jgi:hypothetical protein
MGGAVGHMLTKTALGAMAKGFELGACEAIANIGLTTPVITGVLTG